MARGTRVLVRHRRHPRDGRSLAVRRISPALLRIRPDRSARRPGPAPTSPMRAAEVLVQRAAVGWPHERPASAPVRLFHAASPTDVDHGRAARPGREPGCRRLARRSVRRLRRGGGRPLAVRSRRLWAASFGLLRAAWPTSWPTCPVCISGVRGCRHRRVARTSTARGLHERPDAFLDRACAR